MPKPNPHEVTQLLLAWSNGDKSAMDQLMPLDEALVVSEQRDDELLALDEALQTVHRDWRSARSWLLRKLRGGTPGEA